MPLDLSRYKTAAGAAKALHKYLVETWDAHNARLYRPEENPRGNNWAVSWEGGPYNWAVRLTGGESLAGGEFGTYGGNPEVVGFYSQDHWMAEPHHSFDLQFYNT